MKIGVLQEADHIDLPSPETLINVAEKTKWWSGKELEQIITESDNPYECTLSIKSLNEALSAIDRIINVKERENRTRELKEFNKVPCKHDPSMGNIIEEGENNLKADVMVVAVTLVETQAIKNVITSESNQESKTFTVNNRTYLNLGKVNGAKIVLTFSEMGLGGPGGAQEAVRKGIEALNLTQSLWLA